MSRPYGWLVVALGVSIAAIELSSEVHAAPTRPAAGQGLETASQTSPPGAPGIATQAATAGQDRGAGRSEACGRPGSPIGSSYCGEVRSAAASEAQVEAAQDQVRIGWLQFWGLIISLVFTGSAAAAAALAARAASKGVQASNRSAKAAEDAVAKSDALLTHAEITAERQLRPYLAFTRSRDDPRPISNNTLARLLLKNYGQTPARNVRFFRGMEVARRPIGDREVALPEESEELGEIGPGGDIVFYIDMRALTAPQFAFCGSDAGALLVRYRVEYEFSQGKVETLDTTIVIGDTAMEHGAMAMLGKHERARRADPEGLAGS